MKSRHPKFWISAAKKQWGILRMRPATLFGWLHIPGKWINIYIYTYIHIYTYTYICDKCYILFIGWFYATIELFTFFQKQQKSIKRPLIAITITSMHDYDLHISYYPYILSIVSILSILSNILTTVFRLYTYLHTSSSRFASPQRPRRSNALPRWHVVPESCVEKGLSSDLAQFG